MLIGCGGQKDTSDNKQANRESACSDRTNVPECCGQAVSRFEEITTRRDADFRQRTGHERANAILNWDDERHSLLSDCTMSANSPEYWEPWTCTSNASTAAELDACWRAKGPGRSAGKKSGSDTTVSDGDAEEGRLRGDCLQGIGSACERVAAAYQTGFADWLRPDSEQRNAHSKDRGKAMYFLERACAVRQPAACEKLGDVYLGLNLADTLLTGSNSQRRTPSDIESAQRLFKAACDIRHDSECHAQNLKLAAAIRATAGDLKQAVKWLEAACSAQVAEGCYQLATLYDEGEGVSKSKRRAHVLYEKACSLDHGLCSLACDAGVAAGCKAIEGEGM